MVVKVVKYDENSDKDGFHSVNSDPIEINESSYPHTMHDMVKNSKCDFTILENFGTCQGVEALRIPLMV